MEKDKPWKHNHKKAILILGKIDFEWVVLS